MSLVRYTNKKTGVVTIYESTSHYDPETKQSRPIRKYLGVEDPKTGQLIPSSGKPGRKKGTNVTARTNKQSDEANYKFLYEKEKKENAEKEARIKELEHKNRILVSNLEHLRDVLTKALSFTEPESKNK